MSFNTFSSTQKTYGGSHHVWHEVRKRLLSGGTLSLPLPAIGTVIPAGTPVQIDEAGGTAKLLEFFELADTVSATDTIVKVKAGLGLPKPDEGMPIMVAPTKLTDSGDAIAATNVTYDKSDNTYSFTIPANAFGELSAGSILVKAASVGTGVAVSAIPNALTWNDVFIKEGTYAATVAGVVDGTIYADRIAPLPDSVKALLPAILFQKGV